MSGVYVRIRVAAEHHALPVEQVLEGLRAVGDLGGSRIAPEILGVRNLRGQVIPGIGLARMLGLSGDQPSPLAVAESGKLRAGLLVDEVLDVEELPPALEQVGSEYLLGAFLIDGVFVGALDAAAVMTTPGSRGATG